MQAGGGLLRTKRFGKLENSTARHSAKWAIRGGENSLQLEICVPGELFSSKILLDIGEDRSIRSQAASMNQRKDAQTRLWIRNRDSLGQVVDRGLIEAAHRVWERARLVVIRYLAEDTEAPEILEAAVDSASRAMGNHHSIQFLEAYLLRSVAREAIRRLRKNQRITYIENADLERLAGTISPLTWIANSMTLGESKFFAPVWMSRDG